MISGLVLAAGASRRLGFPKQLLELDGKPLLQHVVDASSAARLDEVVVVLGHAAPEIRARLRLPASARTILNDDHDAGQASSLIAGLKAIDPSAVAAVILLGDQPRVSADLITAVVDAWRDRDAPVVRPYFNGVPGHPVVAARSSWDVLAGASGDEGARSMLEGAGGVVRISLEREPPVDVDTWGDYRRLLEQRGSSAAPEGGQ